MKTQIYMLNGSVGLVLAGGLVALARWFHPALFAPSVVPALILLGCLGLVATLSSRSVSD